MRAQDRTSIDSLQSALSISRTDTLKITLLNDLAGIYFQKNLDSSFFYLENALNIARQSGSPHHKSRTYSNIGTYYYYKEEYLKSLEYIDLAFDIANEINNITIVSYAYYIKAWIFVDLNNLNLANEYANKAMELYKKQDKKEKYGEIYTIYSSIYDLLGDYQKSLEYERKAYNIELSLNHTERLSGSLNNISSLYNHLNKTDSAKIYLWQAVKLNKEFKNVHWLAINYFNLSKVSLLTGEVDSAEWYINQAVKTYDIGGYDVGKPKIHIAKAQIALLRKDTMLAVQFYDSIVHAPKKNEELSIIKEAYRNLAEISHAQKKYESAIGYYKAFKLHDDSIKKGSNASLLTLMELQLEYEKQHHELEKEKNAVTIKMHRKNFLIIILIIILVFVGISLFLLYRLMKNRALREKLEKHQIEKELQAKNREMTANVMTLMKKNEILSVISKKLLEIEEKAVKKETRDAISKISAEIRKSREVELWAEFDLRFKQVHGNFYNSLLKIAPELSPNELRMCAFLRMDISTKDISELTGLDKRTVDNTRYKIRKKFKIDGKTNLTTFLSKF